MPDLSSLVNSYSKGFGRVKVDMVNDTPTKSLAQKIVIAAVKDLASNDQEKQESARRFFWGDDREWFHIIMSALDFDYEEATSKLALHDADWIMSMFEPHEVYCQECNEKVGEYRVRDGKIMLQVGGLIIENMNGVCGTCWTAFDFHISTNLFKILLRKGYTQEEVFDILGQQLNRRDE